MMETDVRLSELFLAQLDAEAPRSRHALETVSDEHDDWQPYPGSMAIGRVATLLASVPFWLSAIIENDSVDLESPRASHLAPPMMETSEDRLLEFDAGLEKARALLSHATEEQLRRPWRLLEGGRLVSQNPRYQVLRETFVQLARYRIQLTSYLKQSEMSLIA